jgi:hypothetical protein
LISVNPFSLQHSYDAAADGGQIKVRADDLFKNPLFDRDISVKISGGYDNVLQQIVGKTVIQGKMTVKKGKVSLGNVGFK